MEIPISDRYSRYEAGTTKITRWLKTAANSCGDLGKPLAVLCIANDAAATARDLIHLATVIATSTKSRVQIPLEILVVVKVEHWRAYAGTESHVDGEAAKANQRHRKSIKVLKQVISILWQRYEARLPKSHKKKHEKLELGWAAILDNIYEYLDLAAPKAPTITPTDRVGDSVAPGPPTHTSNEKSLSEHLKEADKIFALWNTKDGTLSFETDVPSAQQSMFSGRLLGASGCSPYIRRMTDESKKNKAYTRGDSPRSDLQELVLQKAADSILETQDTHLGAAKQGKSRKLTAVYLLAGFKQILKDDELNFNFDYFGLLRSCSELMTTIALTTCDPAGGRGVLATSRLVNIILWVAASTEKSRPDNGLNIEQKMLHQCSSLLAV
ncbi:hypothetical protein LTR17_024966 [Elasticomyces elasticus]|nr:hypothetical protein LTR17_024966 [Elasticomyces elasticus]